MSYQVLARKWRPKNFKEMAGQSHVLQTLVHALESGRLHHAYLFTGTRGVGKTTIARILAKCLNCEQGVTATPCEQCDACREIAEGRFIDLIEVDAASRTRVEDTRELLENVQYAPSRGRFKVYLIDEVHMLSTHSFNALLKTLEEPPPHVKFLLATTDPQKLPITILSRCLQFNLKNFLPEKIVDHLKAVLDAEQIHYEEPALWHLARSAQGSMRDALTLLDQAIAFGQGSVQDASVQALLGTPSQVLVFRLLDAVRTQNAVDLLGCAAEIADNNANYSLLLESMLSALHRAAVAQVLPRAIDNSNGDREHIIALASACSPEDLQLYYQITLKSQDDLRLAPDLQMAFEMYLLRLLAFAPNGPPSALADLPPQDTAESGSEAAARPAALDSEKKKPLSPPAVPAPSRAEPASHRDVPVPDAMSLDTPEGLLNPTNWRALVSRCTLSGISANLLANCSPEQCSADSLALVLDEAQSALYNEQYLADIRTALNSALQRSVEVTIRVGKPANESPAAYRHRQRHEHRQATIDSFNNDVNVQAIMEHFGATLRPDSLILHTEEKS